MYKRVSRRVLSSGLSEPNLLSSRIVTPKFPDLSVRSNHSREGTSYFFSLLVARSAVPRPRLYVAFAFEAVRGNEALRLTPRDCQLMVLRMMRFSFPAASWMYWINTEFSALRSILTVARTGPFSTTVIFAGPLTNPAGGFFLSFQSMFHAGQYSGCSF